MIFMRVRQHDADQIILARLDEIEIGEDQFGTGIFVRAKGHAQIDHQPLAVAAVQVDVHADFARATKREEQQFFSGFH